MKDIIKDYLFAKNIFVKEDAEEAVNQPEIAATLAFISAFSSKVSPSSIISIPRASVSSIVIMENPSPKIFSISIALCLFWLASTNFIRFHSPNYTYTTNFGKCKEYILQNFEECDIISLYFCVKHKGGI